MGKTGSYKHIGLSQRKVIEARLGEDRSFALIADEIGVDPTTVMREVMRNRQLEGPSRNKVRDSNDCAHFRSCVVTRMCEHAVGRCGNRLCKRCTDFDCTLECTGYEPKSCKRIARAPYVCNGCAMHGQCVLDRFWYSASVADAAANLHASEPRKGIDLTPAEAANLEKTVRAGLDRGQSVHHVFATNDLPCSERSFYRYVEEEAIAIRSIDLRSKVRYKKRRHALRESHESGFYAGHEYSDYIALPAGVRAFTVEMDTVMGRSGESKCILSLHRDDLHFQIYLLLDARKRDEVVGKLDFLETVLGRDGFEELLGLILADRGPEFDDIAGIERSWSGGGSRCNLYFTDPQSPSQKPHCEKNHEELRKILPKGTSLAAMDDRTLSLICSHVNSTVRRGIANTTPMQLAMQVFPRELFDALGLRLIAPDQVISRPGILYRA